MREGNIIAVYGIFIKNFTGQLELHCKCGSVRVFDRLSDAGQINIKYNYKFGPQELSVVEPSIQYILQPSGNLQSLEGEKLYMYASKNIKEEEKQFEEMAKPSDTIDLSMVDSFSVAEDNEFQM
ncbi:MAG: hypothetical protein FWC68_03575 [Oscillospiraceae bacterium]|nr:hypothetical protein [Oscillospiraceae bacterium]